MTLQAEAGPAGCRADVRGGEWNADAATVDGLLRCTTQKTVMLPVSGRASQHHGGVPLSRATRHGC